MLDINKIYLGNCLDVMQSIDNASVDMVLCDLPYGTTQNKWDTVIPLDKLWLQYKRIRKPNAALVFTASQPFTSLLGASNITELRYSWVWRKNNATGHLNAHRMPMKNLEDILVFYGEQPTYNPQGLVEYNKVNHRGGNGECYGKSGLSNLQEYTNYPRQILDFAYDTKRGYHPTQKPVALFEYLINTYTNPGDLVLDSCIGSGTTAIACINTKRNFIGIEMNETYLGIANKRIEERLIKE